MIAVICFLAGVILGTRIGIFAAALMIGRRAGEGRLMSLRKICKNCDGRSDKLIQRKDQDGLIYDCYVCTQRDSDKWMQFVRAEDTCLDWEPERKAENVPMD